MLILELFYDRGNHHEFTSLVKELVKPGEMTTNGSYKFEFVNVEKPYESYTGKDVRLRYMVLFCFLNFVFVPETFLFSITNESFLSIPSFSISLCSKYYV